MEVGIPSPSRFFELEEEGLWYSGKKMHFFRVLSENTMEHMSFEYSCRKKKITILGKVEVRILGSILCVKENYVFVGAMQYDMNR